MKKTIVLMTIVLAILAAPVFAETGFSGSVDYNFGTDFDMYDQGTDNSTAITLDGKVGEFSTVSVGIEADDDSNASATIMTLSQDVTGALGVEGPVTFAYKVGRQTYSPADYSGVAGYEDAGADAEIGKSWSVDSDGVYDTDSMLGLVLTFGIADMVNVDIAAYPGSYYEVGKYASADGLADDTYPEFGINAYGTFGMVDASVYYVMSKKSMGLLDSDTDNIDDNGDYFGINLGAVIDALSVGVLFEMAPDQKFIYDNGTTLDSMDTGLSVGRIGVAAQYTIDALTAGLAYKTGFASETVYNDDGSEVTFAESSFVGVNLTYAITEAANVWAAYGTPFAVYTGDLSDSMVYEVGAETTLDGVTYGIGYTKGSEFKAWDAELEDGNVFVSISASF
ncbi:MAG: hypothetical protein PQJ58_14520 [Spirochaetales bacterium]|nr:hypothetical protein [Spirochaetales bacterium]